MSELSEEIEYINQNYKILDVVRDYGYDPLPAGPNRWRMLCPFHNDSAPSLILYEDTNGWFCFGCRAGSDVLEFVKRAEECDFRKAISLLTGDNPELGKALLKKRAERLLEKKIDPVDRVLRELNFSTSVFLRELLKAKPQEISWVDRKFYEIDQFLIEKPELEHSYTFFQGLMKEAANRSI